MARPSKYSAEFRSDAIALWRATDSSTKPDPPPTPAKAPHKPLATSANPLHTARDLVVQAAGVTGYGTTGVIGQRILAGLLPPRRPRVSTRKVKSPISRYHARQDDGRPAGRPPRQRVLDVLDPDPDRHPGKALRRARRRE